MSERTFWPPGDESGWQEYHRRTYDLAAAADGTTRWKILSTGVNSARQVASARSRALTAWVSAFGDDRAGWPLPHPPAALWTPYIARSACLTCWWLDSDCANADAAAASARRHAKEHAPEPVDVNLLLSPLQVFQPYSGRDPDAPRWAG